MEPQFRHEDVAAIPSGYRVATVPSGEHLLHIAFPPGRRRKGSGVLTAILHPRGENPCRLANPTKSEAQRATRERASRIRAARLNPGPQGHKKGCACFACKHAHRNPDQLAQAEKLYRQFHGKAPSEILEIHESAIERKDYTALGDLIELTILAPHDDTVKMSFQRDGVKLASSPNGKQLYLIGGGQDITGSLEMFAADDSKDIADLGDAVQVVYEAAKWQTNHELIEWKHDFGEESGVRPRLFFDRLKKRIFFAGGNYRVERPGIID